MKMKSFIFIVLRKKRKIYYFGLISTILLFYSGIKKLDFGVKLSKYRPKKDMSNLIEWKEKLRHPAEQ
jgi:hypothetical protein